MLTACIIIVILLTALLTKTPSYKLFCDGAQDGLKIAVQIYPALAAILIAAAMMEQSGIFSFIARLVSPLTNLIGLPEEVLPLALIRPLSGSGAIGMLSNILNTCGADSPAGMTASVLAGSTETTFYCLCVYFSATKVKYTYKALPCAVIGDICVVIIGSIFVRLLKF